MGTYFTFHLKKKNLIPGYKLGLKKEQLLYIICKLTAYFKQSSAKLAQISTSGLISINLSKQKENNHL